MIFQTILLHFRPGHQLCEIKRSNFVPGQMTRQQNATKAKAWQVGKTATVRERQRLADSCERMTSENKKTNAEGNPADCGESEKQNKTKQKLCILWCRSFFGFRENVESDSDITCEQHCRAKPQLGKGTSKVTTKRNMTKPWTAKQKRREQISAAQPHRQQ